MDEGEAMNEIRNEEIYDGPSIDWDVYTSVGLDYDDLGLCDCGHYHVGDCPEPNVPCGSYLCCIN